MKLAIAVASLLLLAPNAHNVMAQGTDNGHGSVRGAEHKTYILTFSPGKDPTERANGLAKLAGGSVKHVYTHVLNGAALTLPEVAAAAIAKNPAVATMEEDQEATTYDHATMYSYGQSRVDQCEGGDLGTVGSSTFDHMDASSVRVYILDTGMLSFERNIVSLDSCRASPNILASGALIRS